MLTEIEFELPAEQYELMGFPRLTQVMETLLLYRRKGDI